jgi:hypothetical protein
LPKTNLQTYIIHYKPLLLPTNNRVFLLLRYQDISYSLEGRSRGGLTLGFFWEFTVFLTETPWDLLGVDWAGE